MELFSLPEVSISRLINSVALVIPLSHFSTYILIGSVYTHSR